MAIIGSYVPVLRLKQAERDALCGVDPVLRNGITPLIELIMPSPKRDKDDFRTVLADSKTMLLSKLPKLAKDINKCCTEGSAFLDVHLIDGELRAKTLKTILEKVDGENLTLIPVTHIIPVVSTDADNETRGIAIKYGLDSKNGLCIRIDRYNLNDDDLGKIIDDFVTSNKLNISETDLLIDLGVIGAEDKADEIAAALSELPHLSEWRSFIVTGGAFPKDLSEIDKHSQKQITRYDWQLWNSLNAQPALTRKPLYSDYTIQHPIYLGQIDGVINTSASLRYTDEEQWEVTRGEGLRNEKGAKYKQYPAIAKLVKQQPYFKGADYSSGDLYIEDMAKDDNKQTGNPMTWLKAGINHHLTLVVKALASRTSDKESV